MHTWKEVKVVLMINTTNDRHNLLEVDEHHPLINATVKYQDICR